MLDGLPDIEGPPSEGGKKRCAEIREEKERDEVQECWIKGEENDKGKEMKEEGTFRLSRQTCDGCSDPWSLNTVRLRATNFICQMTAKMRL